MRLLVVGILLAMFAVPSAAVADSPQPGVHVDPGSPAGKQYAFPIASARSEAAGGSGSGGNSNSNPPLFGSGATPGGGSGGAGGHGGHAVSGSGGAGGPGAGGSASSSDPARVAINAAAPFGSGLGGRGGTGGSGWIPLTIGGVLVLVLGGGAGVFMRRRAASAGD